MKVRHVGAHCVMIEGMASFPIKEVVEIRADSQTEALVIFQ